MRVSEIRVERIRVNQGLGVHVYLYGRTCIIIEWQNVGNNDFSLNWSKEISHFVDKLSFISSQRKREAQFLLRQKVVVHSVL